MTKAWIDIHQQEFSKLMEHTNLFQLRVSFEYIVNLVHENEHNSQRLSLIEWHKK